MTPRRRDPRFFELIDLAQDGDAEAAHELWLTYRHDYARDGDPRDQLPTRPMSGKQTNQQEK
jgi:hypothetical protein